MKALTMKKKLKVLEHAFAASAGAYYSINLTKNLVPGSMYQVINDKEYSLNKQMGLPEDAAFTDVVSYWGEKLDAAEKPAYYAFLSVPNLLERYHKGEAHVFHRYWTESAVFEPMLAEQHIVMYEDEENGDILAITYVLDLTREFKEEQYKKELEEKQVRLEAAFAEANKVREYREIQAAVSAVDDVLDKLTVFDKITSEAELEQIMPGLLESLGRYSMSDRAYIFTWASVEDQILRMTNEWCAKGVRPTIGEMQNLKMSDMPNWAPKLRTGKAIISKDWEAEKERTPEEYALFDGQDIHALIVIPIFANNKLNGYIGFDNPAQSKAALSVRLLSSIGGHISSLKDNFLMMKELKNALAAAELNSEIISSISKLYWLIYRMDLPAGTYEEISAGGETHIFTGKQGKISEVFEETCETLIAPEYQEIMREFFEVSTLNERLKDTESVSAEYRSVSGSWHLARFIVKKRDSEGNVRNVLYVVRQIDKEKQIENKYKKKLMENNRVLSGLSLDYTIAFVLNLDTDDYKIIFNQETNHAKIRTDIAKFTDYVDEYAENFALLEFKDAMRRELSSTRIKKRFETEEEYHFSFETIPNTAGLSCFQAHIVKEYDGDGHFAFLGFRSVDEIVKQERFYKEALQKANQALKQQLDMITFALPGGVKISNDDETYSFKYVSEQFANMLGYETPAELMEASGGSIVGLAHPDDLETGIAQALDQYSRADHYEITYRMKCRDGSWKYIEDRGHKVYSADGMVEHWNLILDKHDLMEKSIALESERKANQSKSDFLSRMSHDMRTPLNGIIGLLKIDQDHFADQKLVMENHEKMQIAANHLLSLINDVLEMSKIEDGSVVMTREVINFSELSKEIVDIIGERAAEKKIQLEFKRGEAADSYPYVYGSPVHLRQIFLNIYGNCIKYNHVGGKITTVTECIHKQEGSCTGRWTITDTGIGMSEEFIRHVFEPFVQEKEDARSVYTGVGLGMAIVKGLVEQMGGTIMVSSREGIGSTFVVTIPFETAPVPSEQKEQEDSDSDIRGLHLMLVEDNELNAEIAETMLTDEGAQITVIHDGKQAVELFAGKPEGTFDAILMDIMMPVMDGLTAAREIRASKRTDAKTIPIIAMTANAFREDGEKCFEAGMNAHLVKPLNIEEVKRTIYVQIKNQKK